MDIKTINIPLDAAGKRLSEYLASEGYSISADCGGRGTCGKCKVEVVKGEFLDVDGKAIAPDADGRILSCRAFCTAGGAVVKLRDAAVGADHPTVNPSDGEKISKVDYESLGLAIDIGTTTVVIALLDEKSGRVVAHRTFLNPQKAYGADVVSRITASTEGHLDEMQSILIRDIERHTKDALAGLGVTENFPLTAAVAANPTMLHILCGISPEGMGKYPFTPVFLDTKVIDGKELFGGLNVDKVTLLPSASAFVGSDVTGGVYVCGMTSAITKPSLLVDLGTNGEAVLCLGEEKGGRLICTSTAAGPALEGAGISCGTGGIAGAVCAVRLVDGKLEYDTVMSCPPIGICGSGLVDLISCLLELEIIDETGYMEDDFSLCDNVTLTQDDVRQFQLAKAAIRAGLEVLLDEGDLTWQDLGHLFIAGGLGNHIHYESAVKIGLFSPDFCGEAKAVGNTSLAGAMAVLLDAPDVGALDAIDRAAKECPFIELNLSSLFSEEFMMRMSFEE